MKEVNFVDTTLRDGQASLWAENMRTGMMLLVAERLDNAGFEAIELMASSTTPPFASAINFPKGPWTRCNSGCAPAQLKTT